MKSFTITLLLSLFLPLVWGHGFVTSPTPRQPGAAMESACGTQIYDNQAADMYGNIQGELQLVDSSYNAEACDIWLCKGYKYADNTDNVQTYTSGEVVAMTVDIRAPHTGYANVSIVKTSTNTVIGSALKSWDVYASNASPIPSSEEDFNITIPDDLGDECATAGDCVIQWYWNAESINQTYEACIDFTVDGSGSSSSSSSSSDSSLDISSSAVTSSAVAVSSVAPTSAVAATTAATAAAVTKLAATSVATVSAIAQSTASATSATSTASSSSYVDEALPSGSTIRDMLDRFDTYVEKLLASGTTLERRHARDVFVRRH